MILSGAGTTRQAGKRAADAALASAIAVEVLKPVFHQRRPNDPSATDGFPSGHTAVAFALATSIGDSYRNWRVPAYAWAVGVGWSRHRLGHHYWDQVVAGALLGFGIARWSRSLSHGLCGGLFVRPDGQSAGAAAASPGMASAGEVAVGWSSSF